MRRLYPVLLILGVLLLGAGGFVLYRSLRPEVAGIQIESTPSAAVFLDNERVGVTPYEANRAPGDLVVRLIPQANMTPLVPWETKITLSAQVKTVVRRDFAASEQESSGEIISFERDPRGTKSSLAVVSDPRTAQVSLDGKSQGFTPVPVDNLAPGEHQIQVSAPGFRERTILARSVSGFKLTVYAKLAQDLEEKLSEDQDSTPSPTPAQTLVEILSTPTGFLRVRSAPSTSATESARVAPGKTYPFIEDSPNKDWFKIEYETGKEGWVSSQYAKKKEES